MKLKRPKIIEIIAHLVRGVGIRATAELCGVDPATVLRYLLLVGTGCGRIGDRLLRELHLVQQVQLDEMFGYLHTRERKKKPGAPAEHGECWIFTAIDVPSRAIISYEIGKRTLPRTIDFVRDLRARTVGRLSISSDGNGSYETAIPLVFGDDATHVLVEKKLVSGKNARGQRVAGVRVISKKTIASGHPTDLKAYQTSYVERENRTRRELDTRYGRRTAQASKSMPHLVAADALYRANFNFCRPHPTFRKSTPAQLLGVTDHMWSLDELVDMALSEPEPPPLVLPELAAPKRSRAAHETPAQPTVEAARLAPGRSMLNLSTLCPKTLVRVERALAARTATLGCSVAPGSRARWRAAATAAGYPTLTSWVTDALDTTPPTCSVTPRRWGSGSEPLQLRVAIAKLHAWRAAAEATHTSLGKWVQGALDAAAAAHGGSGGTGTMEPSDEGSAALSAADDANDCGQ